MKHYKKILCLLLVLTLAFTTVGCQWLPQLPTEPTTPTEPGNLIPESTSLTAEDFGCSNTYPEVDMSDYTDYYFDAVAGDDANDGKSEQTPKKTLKAAEEIAAAIGYLLTHKEEATEMGLRGASLVEEKFCWEKEAESLLDLYCRLTGEGTE